MNGTDAPSHHGTYQGFGGTTPQNKTKKELVLFFPLFFFLISHRSLRKC